MAELDELAALRSRERRMRRGRGHGVAAAVAVALAVVAASSAAAVLIVAGAPGTLLGCSPASAHLHVAGADTRLTAADGSSLGYVPTGQNREPVALARISHWLPAATVAIEDRRFWHHGAIDPVGIGRAALADLQSGGALQGGSTLTQQLVRNRYLAGERMTVPRKLVEACMAIDLFRRWSRRRILTAYLNTVFYGHHARGVEAAAWTYFSRSAAHLSLARSALLAGLPQAPSQYDPLRDAADARARRNEVLAAMRRDGVISRRRYRAAAAAPLGIRPGNRYARVRFPTFFSAARDALVRRFGTGRVRHGGLRVRTTLVPHLQRLAEHAIDGWIHSAPDPAAALVAIDPRTGAVSAMAARAPGSARLHFNLATQSRRQAGSAFKVFTLATALQQGIPLSSVWHGPPSLTIPDRRCLNAGGAWMVHNFADEAAGTMTLLQAIAHSVNTIFAQVAVRVGPQNIVRTARRMGIRSPLKPVCSITLGPEGVSPLEMTGAFATLAAGGVRHDPWTVQRVASVDGAVLARAAPSGRRVLAPGLAGQLTYALSGVIRGGTGTAADPRRPAAGKTGTAERFKDAWFCGYVPQLATCVWIGHPAAETPMTSLDGFAPVVGGSVPARIWHDFMVPALKGRRVVALPQVSASQVAQQPTGRTAPGVPLAGGAPASAAAPTTQRPP